MENQRQHDPGWPTVESFNQVAAIDALNSHACFSRGVALHQLKHYEQALANYDKALALNPRLAEAHNNRGNTLKALRRYQQALDSFAAALQLGSDPSEVHINCGNIFLEIADFEAAEQHYSQALRSETISTQNKVHAYTSRGIATLQRKHYRQALNDFHQAYRLQPNLIYLEGMRVHVKQHLCDWEDIEADIAKIETSLIKDQQVITPFSFLSVCDSPALQRKAAKIYIQNTCSEDIKPIPPHQTHAKIRIAYISSDFQNHPISYQMAEIFERHDRDRFEIYGFSTGPSTGDEMHHRITKAIDHFLDLRFTSDADIAQLARSLEIDIAIDLNGLSYGDRTHIFALRAAPIQVNYLGYPGTMGATFIDYVLADQIVIPSASRRHYSEKVVYLPDTFQANSSTQPASSRVFIRDQENLPATSFVYCCFNNNFKILPATFNLWMRILNRVDNSVLWLLEGNPDASVNLQKRAAEQGINPTRLIFAQPLPLDQHIARQQLADLFLDTHPFNAGASASPALRAGLPVLTRIGKAFAGRMAASLLHAIGMPDLVTSTEAAYEDLAIRIGNHPDLAQSLKDRLRKNQQSTPLFDTKTFTLNLESAYAEMYARNQAGLPPDHIHIASRHPVQLSALAAQLTEATLNA